MAEEGILLADGWEECFVGFASQFGPSGRVTVAVYDYEKMVDQLIRETSADCADNCDCDHFGEAEEYLEFNVLGAYVGPGTPVYLTARSLEEALQELDERT